MHGKYNLLLKFNFLNISINTHWQKLSVCMNAGPISFRGSISLAFMPTHIFTRWHLHPLVNGALEAVDFYAGPRGNNQEMPILCLDKFNIPWCLIINLFAHIDSCRGITHFFTVRIYVALTLCNSLITTPHPRGDRECYTSRPISRVNHNICLTTPSLILIIVDGAWKGGGGESCPIESGVWWKKTLKTAF